MKRQQKACVQPISCQSPNQFETEPFLIDIITPYLSQILDDYFDFINWHRTCSTAWKPLKECLYCDYLSSFIREADRRNTNAFKMTLHADIMGRLEVCNVVTTVKYLLDKVRDKLTNLSNVATYSTGIIFPHGWTKGNMCCTDGGFSSYALSVLNITRHHVLVKYGWHLHLCDPKLVHIIAGPFDVSIDRKIGETCCVLFRVSRTPPFNLLKTQRL